MGGQLPEPTNLGAWLDLVANEEEAFRAIASEDCPIDAMEKALQLFPELERQVVYNAHAPGKPRFLVININATAIVKTPTRETILHSLLQLIISSLASTKRPSQSFRLSFTLAPAFCQYWIA